MPLMRLFTNRYILTGNALGDLLFALQNCVDKGKLS